MNEINIHTFSANPLIAENIRSLLKSEKYISFSSHYNSINGGLRNIGKNSARLTEKDILFIDDFSFNKNNIIKFLNIINQSATATKKIIYTSSFNSKYVKDLSGLNVNGLLHKQETQLFPSNFTQEGHGDDTRKYEEKFINLVKSVDKSIICYDNIINSLLIRKYAWAKGIARSIPDLSFGEEGLSKNKQYDSDLALQKRVKLIKFLTSQETKLLLCLAKGYKNRKIAGELNIIVATVETYKVHILKKLELKSTNDLIIFAVRNEEILGYMQQK